MPIFKCKMCGGDLRLNENVSVGECSYCGTHQTLPRLDDDKRANLYDRANHFRRNGEFDKAAAIYDTILNEDKTDAEAYWSLVLCKYGIEYVEDPKTKKRIPTCNRTHFTSIFADEDYKQTITNAEGGARTVYESEAQTIDRIQKGILAISANEEPFDVFICYKETDNNGRRTKDSVLANELYHQLTQEGFKVFFARITLEDKLGTAYEPYIFAALNSAKVMVVIGTTAEHFNAPWVKNEWSRYLGLIKSNVKKVLIPAYKDMDVYNLPDEFSHLQAQDMSKLGFMQDLIRGIRKIIKDAETEPAIKVVEYSNGNTNAAPLLKRAYLCIEDKDWDKADLLLEQVLNLDPENAQAYIGKLMVRYKMRSKEEFETLTEIIDGNSDYQKAIRFASEADKRSIREYAEAVYRGFYNRARQLLDKQQYEDALKLFIKAGGYKDSHAQIETINQIIFGAKMKRKQQLSDYLNATEEVVLACNGAGRWIIQSATKSGRFIGDLKLTSKRLVFTSSLLSLPKKDCEILITDIKKAQFVSGYFGTGNSATAIQIQKNTNELFVFLVKKGTEHEWVNRISTYIELIGEFELLMKSINVAIGYCQNCGRQIARVQFCQYCGAKTTYQF